MRLLQKLLSLHGAIVTFTAGPAAAAQGGHVLRRPAAAPSRCPPPVQYPVPPVPQVHSPGELQALAWSDADVEKYLVLPLREINVYTSEAYTNPDSPYGWDTHERFVAKHSPNDASGSGRGTAPGAKEHAPMSSTSFRDLFSDRFVPSLKAYFRSLHARARTSPRTRARGKTAASAVHPSFVSTRWPEADDAALVGRTLVHPAVHRAVHCHALARLALDGRLQDILWLKTELESVSTELVEDHAAAADAGAGGDEEQDDEQRKLHQDDLQHVPRITLDLTVDLLGLCFRGKRAEQRDWNVTDTDKTEYFLPVGVVITRHRSPLNLLLVNMVNEIDEAHQAAHRKTKNLDTVSGLPVGQPGSSAPRHTPRRGRGTESARPPADVYSHVELSVAVEEVGEVRDPLLALLEAVGLRFTGSAPAGAAREDDAAHSGADPVVEEQLARLQTALFAERFDDEWWGKPAKIFWPATLEERRGFMAQPNVVSLAAGAVPTFLHASDQLQLDEEQWRRRSSVESAVTGNMTLSLVMIYGLDPRLASPTPLSFNVPASGMDGEEVPGQHTTVRKTRPYELMERLADGQRGLWMTARTDSATPSTTRPQVEGDDSSQLQQLADHYLFKDSFCSQLIGKIAALRLVKLTETMEEFESAPDVAYLSDDVASGSEESVSKVGQVVRNGFREAGGAHDDARMVAAMTAFRHLETLALETVGVFRKVVGATRGDVARTLELVLDNVWIRSRSNLYSFIGAEDYGHSVDRSIKLDRPELLEKTIAAARKRFAELPSEHEATGTSTTENKNEMATSLRALSLKALFERGRKPKLAQMLMRQWLDDPTLVSLRRYETFVFFVEKGKLPLWQARVHSNDRDITIAGEMCRWIKEEDETEAGRGHHRQRKLISFLPAGEDIDTSASPSDIGMQDDVRDLSFRKRSPKCDSLLVYAAVHSNSHAEEFFGPAGEAETAEQAGHQLARGNPSSPYFDHGEWKKLKKMQYESAAVAYYSRPSQEQIAGTSSPLYSGVQVLRAVAAGSTVREVALLLAFGETPLTEEEAAVEALLPAWASISQLKTRKERDELKEKAKKQLREARRLAHWNAANNHLGNHAEMANRTLIPLSSHLLRLLNILPKNARDRTSRELEQSRYLTDLELERLLRAFRDEVEEQGQAFWAGAEYSITAHIKDPEHALHEWLFFREDRKDDVAKQYDYMKKNVLAFLKSLVNDDFQSIYDERTRAGRNTGRDAGAEQDQDNPLQRAGSQRLAVLPERPGRGNMLRRLRQKTRTNNLLPSPKGTATERSSALVSELFPGPLEADSGVAIRRTPRRTSKDARVEAEFIALLFASKDARVEAEFIALLFVLYTKQREDEATTTAAQVGPDGFAALVRTILEGQNEYWNDQDDHDKGVHASCRDGRIERLQTSLIGRITPPDARGALTTTSNAADQLLHLLSGFFSNSPTLAGAREGDELLTYPALEGHFDAFLHPDEGNEERSGNFVPRDLRYMTEMLLVGKRDALELSRVRDDFWKMGFEEDETDLLEGKKAVAWVRRLVANRLLHVHADLWSQDKLLFSRLATIAAANEEFSTLTSTLAVTPTGVGRDAAVDVGTKALDRHPKLSDESKRKKALAAESYLFLIDHQTPSRNQIQIVKRDENDPGQRDDDGDEDADSGNEDEDHEAGVAEEGEHDQLEVPTFGQPREEREAAPAPESENAADQETKLAREQGVSTKHDRLQVEQKLRRFLRLVNSIVNMIVSDSARLNDWIDEMKTRPEQEQEIKHVAKQTAFFVGTSKQESASESKNPATGSGS
eukprot:g12195.t1